MEEATITEPPPSRWAIAVAWLEENSRSIPILTRDYLCSKCAKKLASGKMETSPEALIAQIQNCCSRSKGFISSRLPILESAFRLFLANGNQPITLEEMGQKLSDLRGGDPYRTNPYVLYRLLKSDSYYGIQEITGD